MEATTKHIFSVCHHIKALQNQLKMYFNDFIFMPDLTTQIAIIGFHGNNHDFIIKNYIHV